MNTSTKYYGIYRGTVVNNLDPYQMGRIMVTVTDAGGITPSSWAMPAIPLAGKQEGTYMVPQLGAGVWVQFEAGDPDKPVWTGGWWGDTLEVPLAAYTPPPPPPGQTIVVQTTMQHLLMVSDNAPVPMLAPIPAPAPPGTGGIVLRSPSGAMIVVNDAGIFINNGKGASIDMVGNLVMINKVSLVVA